MVSSYLLRERVFTFVEMNAYRVVSSFMLLDVSCQNFSSLEFFNFLIMQVVSLEILEDAVGPTSLEIARRIESQVGISTSPLGQGVNSFNITRCTRCNYRMGSAGWARIKLLCQPS